MRELLRILAEELHNEAESRSDEANTLLDRSMAAAANRHETIACALNSLAVVARRAAERVPEEPQIRIELAQRSGAELDALAAEVVAETQKHLIPGETGEKEQAARTSTARTLAALSAACVRAKRRLLTSETVREAGPRD